MPRQALPIWGEITREERYFTSVLAHDIKSCPKNRMSLSTLLGQSFLEKDDCLENLHPIVDCGYEVCLFRDLAHCNKISRHRTLFKITFDLLLTLQDGSIIIIEAKAHEGFKHKQIQTLRKSKEILLQESLFRSRNIWIFGLVSSMYDLHVRSSTKHQFDGWFTWAQLASIIPNSAKVFSLADRIYRN